MKVLILKGIWKRGTLSALVMDSVKSYIETEIEQHFKDSNKNIRIILAEMMSLL